MMNLNSLLNGNSSAVDQPNDHSQKTLVVVNNRPPRNRTPWDADGYSLPINTSMLKSNMPQQMSNEGDWNASIQNSPHHRYSDSRSSLFSSTTESSHSRFSSTSSTMENFVQPNSSRNPSNSIFDSPSPKTAAQSFLHDNVGMETTRNNIDYLQSRSSSPSGTRKDKEMTKDPTRSFTDHSIVFNRYLMTPIKERENSSTTESVVEKGRPSSPSDAMLIKRQQTKLCIRLAKEDSGIRLMNAQQSENFNQEKKSEAPRRGSMPHYMSHKRAYSAPNFHHPAHQISMPNTNSLMASVELTPPNSIHPDHPSPKLSSLHQTPVTPPHNPSEMESTTIKCMYVADCDTGSQLRKAISHIFGRNKICTRQIPSRVWVHYCRKHYQRSRYRNPKEYAKLQCDLVQQQIRRVHEWSQTNAQVGRAGVVQDWTISVRKREQKRLDDIQNNRKRKTASSDRDEEEDEDFNLEPGCKNAGSAIPATAVPQWLLEHCRKGYSTREILEIFNRLHQEILNDSISTFPDIEILPNISIEQEESWSPSSCIKRPHNFHHKRAKSLTAGLSSIYESGDHRLNTLYMPSTEASNNNYIRRMSSSAVLGTVDSVYQPLNRSMIQDRNRHGSALALHTRIEENQIPEDYENLSPLCKQSLHNFIPQQNINQQPNGPIDLGGSYQSLPHQPFHQRSLSDFGTLSNMAEAPLYSSVYPDAKSYFKEQDFEPGYIQQSPWKVPREMPQDMQRVELRSTYGRFNSMPSSYYTPSLPAMREHPLGAIHHQDNNNNNNDVLNQNLRKLES